LIERLVPRKSTAKTADPIIRKKPIVTGLYSPRIIPATASPVPDKASRLLTVNV
jgi:hypothetical protein